MKLEESRLTELAAKAKEGSLTEADKNELTDGFVKLVFHVARSYGGSNHTKVDDYISAGLFGVAYAITNVAKMEDLALNVWIVHWIRRFINRFRQNDHVVRIPPRTYFRCKKLGLTLPGVQPIGRDEPFGESGHLYDVHEILSMCADTDQDLEIIKLRSRGYTMREVAQRLGISKSQVSARCSEMAEEYDRLMGE